MAAPTTCFQTSAGDAAFVDQINNTFPAPGNQPYLFYLFAAKGFYQSLKSIPVETLLSHSEQVIDAYKAAFQSRYSIEQLDTMCQVTTAFLAGELSVVFTLPANSIALSIEGNTLIAEQGPYYLNMTFSADHQLTALRFD